MKDASLDLFEDLPPASAKTPQCGEKRKIEDTSQASQNGVKKKSGKKHVL